MDFTDADLAHLVTHHAVMRYAQRILGAPDILRTDYSAKKQAALACHLAGTTPKDVRRAISPALAMATVLRVPLVSTGTFRAALSETGVVMTIMEPYPRGRQRNVPQRARPLQRSERRRLALSELG